MSKLEPNIFAREITCSHVEALGKMGEDRLLKSTELEAEDAATLLKAHAEVMTRQLERCGVESGCAKRAARIVVYGEVLKKVIQGLESGEVGPEDMNEVASLDNINKLLELGNGQSETR